MHRLFPIVVLAACAAPTAPQTVAIESSGLRRVIVHVDRLE